MAVAQLFSLGFVATFRAFMGPGSDMVEASLEFLFALLTGVILPWCWDWLLLPAVWIVSFPVILVVAVFRKGPYGAAVFEIIGAVHCFWKDWAFLFFP